MEAKPEERESDVKHVTHMGRSVGKAQQASNRS